MTKILKTIISKDTKKQTGQSLVTHAFLSNRALNVCTVFGEERGKANGRNGFRAGNGIRRG